MRLAAEDDSALLTGSDGRTETALFLSEVLFVELLSGRVPLSALFSVDLLLEAADDDEDDDELSGRIAVPGRVLVGRSLVGRFPFCAAADEPGRLLPDVPGRLSSGLLGLLLSFGLLGLPALPGLPGLSLLPGLPL